MVVLVVPVTIIGRVWSTIVLIVVLIALAGLAVGYRILLVQIRAERRRVL